MLTTYATASFEPGEEIPDWARPAFSCLFQTLTIHFLGPAWAAISSGRRYASAFAPRRQPFL